MLVETAPPVLFETFLLLLATVSWHNSPSIKLYLRSDWLCANGPVILGRSDVSTPALVIAIRVIIQDNPESEERISQPETPGLEGVSDNI
jgi:hypothetical protein